MRILPIWRVRCVAWTQSRTAMSESFGRRLAEFAILVIPHGRFDRSFQVPNKVKRYQYLDKLLKENELNNSQNSHLHTLVR